MNNAQVQTGQGQQVQTDQVQQPIASVAPVQPEPVMQPQQVQTDQTQQPVMQQQQVQTDQTQQPVMQQQQVQTVQTQQPVMQQQQVQTDQTQQSVQTEQKSATTIEEGSTPQTESSSTVINNVNNLDIPNVVIEKHSALVNLILETRSMNDKERQYWFNILPVMNEEQVEKLRTILNNEKEKLAEIEARYSNLSAEKAPVVKEMAEDEILEKIQKVQEIEAQHKAAQEEEEAAILAQLENL